MNFIFSLKKLIKILILAGNYFDFTNYTLQQKIDLIKELLDRQKIQLHF